MRFLLCSFCVVASSCRLLSRCRPSPKLLHFQHVWTRCQQTISWCLLCVWEQVHLDITMVWFSRYCTEFMCERDLWHSDWRSWGSYLQPSDNRTNAPAPLPTVHLVVHMKSDKSGCVKTEQRDSACCLTLANLANWYVKWVCKTMYKDSFNYLYNLSRSVKCFVGNRTYCEI